MPAFSIAAQSSWVEKNQYDRAEWFAFHGDPMARARGKFAAALEEYAIAIREHGAAERRNFSPEEFINDVFDTADSALAEEVQAYLGC